MIKKLTGKNVVHIVLNLPSRRTVFTVMADNGCIAIFASVLFTGKTNRTESIGNGSGLIAG